MLILGLTNSIDSTVSLLNESGVLSAAAEERFSRIKLDDQFPYQALNFVLKSNGISLKDIDVVSYCWAARDSGEHIQKVVERVIDIVHYRPEAKDIVKRRFEVALKIAGDRVNEFYDEFVTKNKLGSKLETFNHHPGHAATTFFASPFERALVVTCDGRGDFQSTGVYLGEGTELKEVDWVSMFDSPGFMYGATTDLLGFKPHRHEGKITGLAAYGDPTVCRDVFRRMIMIKNYSLWADVGYYYKPFHTQHLPRLIKRLRYEKREDVAAGVQAQLEYVMTRYINYFVKKYKIGNICLAGGVFANVKLNQRIRELPGVKHVFVYPNMGDGGLASGAALLSLAKRGIRPEPIGMPYWGPGFTDKQVSKTLRQFGKKIEYQKLKDKVQTTIELLKQEKVVGWFQGRMEYGPRALGNRSVLYHAHDATVNDWLNKRLKRTEFMPFAPVTTDKLASQCFKGWTKDQLVSKYMTMCYDCTPGMKKNSPAVVHVDGTARPQVVWRKDNPDYYDVVDQWHRQTGSLCLINTSFNQHEHPIVCSPKDAVESLLANNVDVLMMGSYLVRRG